MRTIIITLAAAASALAVATPASAQYQQPYQQPYYGSQLPYQQPYQQPYGYQQPYQQGYGYQQGYAQTGRWSQQVDQISNQVRDLSNRGLLTSREVRQMNYNVNVVRNAIQKYGRRGLTQYEASDLDRRVRNLQISLNRSANDADTRYGRSNQYQNPNAYPVDRDGDGRWDN